MSDWCILRTKGGHTLKLAQSLGRAGFMAWTPSTHVGNPKDEQFAPVLPSYVFARTRNLMDLMQLANDPMSRHPDFSVFHYLGAIPLVADAELTALRQHEERDRLNAMRRKPRARQLRRGEGIRIEQGPFAGLSGIVERDDGKFAMILFGNTSVKVATFLLQSDLRAAA